MFYKKKINRLEDHIVRLSQTTAFLKRENQLLKDRVEVMEDIYLKNTLND